MYFYLEPAGQGIGRKHSKNYPRISVNNCVDASQLQEFVGFNENHSGVDSSFYF